MDHNKLAGEMQEQVVRWRRDLHRIPELGNHLPQTSKYVQEVLSGIGIPYVTMVDGSGILATITGAGAGKTIALRADMDGLPISEEAPVSFKSTNGNMHACGHDAHTAMLLGAAKILSDHKADLKGTVKLIFQPGEEGPGGAKPMIKEGCLDGVDAVFGQHIGCIMRDVEESGKIIVTHGNAMACADSFKIKIIGHGAHGAMPESSIDPISIAAQVINGIYMIKARNCPSVSPSVISVCTIHSGTASNIIPRTAELEGTTRSVDIKTRNLLAARIEQVLKGICDANGASYEFDYVFGYDVTTNNPEMADLVIKSAKDLGMAEDVVPQLNPVMGAEDMSYFLNDVPGAYYFLSSVTYQDGQVYGHHNSQFMLDETVFSKGVALLLQIVSNYLN